MKYRVFKYTIWSDVMYIIHQSISFTELKNNTHTSMLNKSNYYGEFDFDERFLDKLFEFRTIKDKKYYFKYSYEKYTTEGLL